jgi:hypothetical protein
LTALTVGVAVVTVVNCPAALYVITGIEVALPVGPAAAMTPPTGTLLDPVPVGRKDVVSVVQVGTAIPLIAVITWLEQVVAVLVPVAAAAPTIVLPFDPHTCVWFVVFSAI